MSRSSGTSSRDRRSLLDARRGEASRVLGARREQSIWLSTDNIHHRDRHRFHERKNAPTRRETKAELWARYQVEFPKHHKGKATPTAWLFKDVQVYERPVEYVAVQGQQTWKRMHFTPGHPEYTKEKQTKSYC